MKIVALVEGLKLILISARDSLRAGMLAVRIEKEKDDGRCSIIYLCRL